MKLYQWLIGNRQIQKRSAKRTGLTGHSSPRMIRWLAIPVRAIRSSPKPTIPRKKKLNLSNKAFRYFTRRRVRHFRRRLACVRRAAVRRQRIQRRCEKSQRFRRLSATQTPSPSATSSTVITTQSLSSRESFSSLKSCKRRALPTLGISCIRI